MGIEEKTTEKDIKKQSLLEATALLSVVPPGIEPGTQGFSVLCSSSALKASPKAQLSKQPTEL